MLELITDQTRFDLLVNHVTQSWEWGEFRIKTHTIKKVLRLGDETKGFQVIFSKVPHLPFTIAYLPRSTAPTSEELEEIKKYCTKERAIFLKIEPLENFTLQGSNFKLGEPILPQHTIYVDLTRPEDQLFKEMHDKTRYNVRLAFRKGVIVREENTDEGLEKFIDLLTATEKRQGFYSHSPKYYRVLWKALAPSGTARILNAYAVDESGDHLANSLMLFKFKDFIYYPYGGSNPDFKEHKAMQLLQWEAIRLGKKLGAKTYDLWGSYKYTKGESDPFYGIYRLKSGFGGKEVDFPDTIDIPLSPLYSLFIFANSVRWNLLRFKKLVKIA